jgi:excisionase family DNA binding protein
MTTLSLREAAEQAGTSTSTIRRAIKSGRMSAVAARAIGLRKQKIGAWRQAAAPSPSYPGQ